ncbi:hypothetical protein PV10_04657 [Exophiala mesophila]|uniref:Alpha-1,3-mannosyltransferase n=1 Tax=Exophiala mesophila TaxID=212818 RepID=A0A0D1ZHX2_EXOME|nr:uncharacterized protein PV10_04657 [Exophiala mesophila]KIV93444.1 hypothetical protein PV10_04657 [Exophiala mesophila]
MPPHLHPRSMATSTLFAGTLLASFVVVGIPHVFPCPRPRTRYADSPPQFDEQGKPIPPQRMRRKLVSSSPETVDGDSTQNSARQPAVRRALTLAQQKELEEEAVLFRELQREADALEREAGECPVPKPSGVIGRLLGFTDRAKEQPQQQQLHQSQPPVDLQRRS